MYVTIHDKLCCKNKTTKVHMLNNNEHLNLGILSTMAHCKL